MGVPPRVTAIFCDWSLVQLVISPSEDTPSRTFIHQLGGLIAVTRFTGETITGHIVLNKREYYALTDAGIAL